MGDNAKSLEQWGTSLTTSEIEILMEAGDYDLDDELTPGEVLEILIDWYGGLANALQVKTIIRRVYGIEL